MSQQTPSERVLDRLADYSNQSLLEELQRVADVIGTQALTRSDIEKHARCSYTTLKQRFGGLHAALKAAGLTGQDIRRNVSDEELLRELARIWDLVLTHEGRRPFHRDLIKYKSKLSRHPYYRRWGSWIKACEALLEWEGKASEVSSAAPTNTDTEKPLARLSRRKRAIPLRVRYAIFLRDRFTCKLCGRCPSSSPCVVVHVDHIVPESKGGTLDPSNLRCVCEECNLGKGDLLEF
jgi:hypothetical protein